MVDPAQKTINHNLVMKLLAVGDRMNDIYDAADHEQPTISVPRDLLFDAICLTDEARDAIMAVERAVT